VILYEICIIRVCVVDFAPDTCANQFLLELGKIVKIGQRKPKLSQKQKWHNFLVQRVRALQTDLLHLVHGDSVPEERLHAFLSWYSAERPETRPQHTHADSRDAARLATRRDDDDVDDGDINNFQQQRGSGKIIGNGNKCRSSPTSGDNSTDTPAAAMTPNRWFLHGAVLSPRPRTTRGDVDSGSPASDGDGDYRDRTASGWLDGRPGSQPSFDDYGGHRATATRRHKYEGWCQRQCHASSDDRGDEVTSHLSLGNVAERTHGGEDTVGQINITRRDEDDDDDDEDRRAPPAHRRTRSPPSADFRRGIDCSGLHHRHHRLHLQQTLSDTSSRQYETATPSHAEHRDADERQDLTAGPPSRSQQPLPRSYSMSPMSPPPQPPPPPPPFNDPSEFRSPVSAVAPLPPLGAPLSHELVRHFREQQVLRLAAVSRAIHHQLRYLHHGAGGGGGGGSASPSNSAAAAAGLYPAAPPHRHHPFDAGLLLGAGAATSYTLHNSIMPGFRAADLALTSGRDSPGGSDISNDNASGMLTNSATSLRSSTAKHNDALDSN